jgi:hypothetical protein
MRNTLVNSKRVTLLTKEMTSQLPRVLYWRKELDSQGNIIEKEIIMPLPFPVPTTNLYDSSANRDHHGSIPRYNRFEVSNQGSYIWLFWD